MASSSFVVLLFLVLPDWLKDTRKSLLDVVEVGDGILIDWKLKLFVSEVGYSFVQFMTSSSSVVLSCICSSKLGISLG
jgi:hypothetical protein